MVQTHTMLFVISPEVFGNVIIDPIYYCLEVDGNHLELKLIKFVLN